MKSQLLDPWRFHPLGSIIAVHHARKRCCGWYGRRHACEHEGSIITIQEAPPSPVFLRNGHGRFASLTVPPSGAYGLGERWTATLDPLDSWATDENGHGMITDGMARADKPTATSARKPTFLQRERWKAIQKARRNGMSLRAIERELGIHRGTIRKYLDADGPPTRQSREAHTASSSVPSRHNRVTFTLNT